MAKKQELTTERVYVRFGENGERTEQRKEELSDEEIRKNNTDIMLRIYNAIYNPQGYEVKIGKRDKSTA